MRKNIIIFVTLLAGVLISGCTQSGSPTIKDNTLTVYAYDSLTADYGLFPQIIEEFESTENVTVEVVSFADTGTMLNQAIAEKDNPKADVVMGLDNIDFLEISENNLFAPYQAERATKISSDLWFDDEYTMTPFDYGYIGFVYDSEAITFNTPISLAELASSTYKDQIIIEQPGLSSPGTQLLLWSNAALDDAGADSFWLNMANTVLTVAPDWSTAYYTMFLEGEAPIVLSYLTSPAYHIDQEFTERYKAIPITEGYIRQVEGVGVVNGTNNEESAQAFVDYVLSDKVQNAIPTTQWIFPVLGDSGTWPKAYSQIIVPKESEVLEISVEDIAQLDGWITEWNRTFGVE